MDTTEELLGNNNQQDSNFQEKPLIASGSSMKNVIQMDKKNSDEDLSIQIQQHQRPYLQTSSSVSEDETVAEFANSRTIIRP
jgi:hypothetical protein